MWTGISGFFFILRIYVSYSVVCSTHALYVFFYILLFCSSIKVWDLRRSYKSHKSEPLAKHKFTYHGKCLKQGTLITNSCIYNRLAIYMYIITYNDSNDLHCEDNNLIKLSIYCNCKSVFDTLYELACQCVNTVHNCKDRQQTRLVFSLWY